jgi:hypothetical protein
MNRSLYRLILAVLSLVSLAACGSASAASTKALCATTAVSMNRSRQRSRLVDGLDRHVRERAVDGEAATRANLADRNEWVASFDSVTHDQLAGAALADSVTGCTDEYHKAKP